MLVIGALRDFGHPMRANDIAKYLDVETHIVSGMFKHKYLKHIFNREYISGGRFCEYSIDNEKLIAELVDFAKITQVAPTNNRNKMFRLFFSLTKNRELA